MHCSFVALSLKLDKDIAENKARSSGYYLNIYITLLSVVTRPQKFLRLCYNLM